MSVKAMSRVMSAKVGSSTRKSVLLIMADAAFDDGSGVWLSKPTIADRTEVGLKTVKRTISELVKDGLLIKSGRKKIANGYVQIYDLNFAKIEGGLDPENTPEKHTGQNDPRVNLPPDTVSNDTVTPCKMTPQTIHEPSFNHPFILSARENWNLMAEQNGLGEVGLMTPERVRMLERAAEHLGSETAVLEAITKIPNIPHWVGANGWRCDFDWVFRDRNHVLKAYESKPPTPKDLSHGNYQNKKPASANARRQADQVDGFRRAIESFTE